MKTKQLKKIDLRQTQSTMVYKSKIKILVYTIKWDDAAFVSNFYEKFKIKIKNAMVAINRFESLEYMINIGVKIDDRQYNKFIKKKTWFKPITKNKPNLK